ncbi:hypothetical protein WJX77_003797 [Trebouxia sp. C0004]
MRRAACACPAPFRSTVGDEELSTVTSLTPQQWQQAHDSTGRVQKFRQTCKLIRKRGLAKELRCQAWPLLLSCYTPDETVAGRQAVNDAAHQELSSLLQQAAAPDAHNNFELSSGGETWEQNVRRIATDVDRTDCGSGTMTAEERSAIDVRLTHILTAYAYCDPVVGYCQGMADILSPFLLVFPHDDALAFMCFAAFMGQIRQNFLEGQPGVHSSVQHIGSLLQHADPKLWRQIEKLDISTGVFAFRMLVCQFRRELTFDDVFSFWEQLWAAEQLAHCQLKEHCIAALLRLNRKRILRLRSPEDFIQFVNQDIIPLDGPATIKAAYKLWKQTGSKQKK